MLWLKLPIIILNRVRSFIRVFKTFFETLKLIKFLRLSWLAYGVLMGVLLFGNISSARAQLTGISEIGHSYQADARGGTETSIGDTG